MVLFRKWTRDWWNQFREGYTLVTSSAVVEELSAGSQTQKKEKLRLIESLEMLATTNEVLDIANIYISRFVMPNDISGDALHLALASYYRCDILLTWNCRHLANYKKAEHIKKVNALLGIATPSLLTPLELMGD